MTAFPSPTLPERIPLLPVRSTVVFPMGATALQVAWAPNVEALTAYPEPDLLVGIVTTLDDETPINPANLEKVGVVARVLDRLNLAGGVLQTTLQALQRIHLDDVRYENGFYTARPRLAAELPTDELHAERLIELILTTLGGVAAKVERISDEAPKILRNNVTDPSRFADLVATLCHFNVRDQDQVLQTLDVTERLDGVLGRLQETWNRVRELEREQLAAAAGEPTDRTAGDRPAALRNQIRALQAQLGEADPAERETVEFMRRIDRARLPARVAAVARREAERLRELRSAGSESTDARNYLEALLALPWSRAAESEPIDLARVRHALDEHHLGLDDVKRRLLEVLSVAQLRGHARGLVPCLVGPPGVGKRSLAEAVARGLGRPLARVELGGRGEAQLFGARRSRSGARPGRLVTALADAEVQNPVYLLDEIDETGLGNVEGDPVEALEEFLDPESRTAYVDRYIDVPIDFSDAVLIATATDATRIPRRLREYLIEIRIAGYTAEEKAATAREYLLPRLAAEHGFAPDEIAADEDTLLFLARGYARDAGLGNLQRVLAAILRSLALEKASGTAEHWTLTPQRIEDVLGTPRHTSTPAESAPEVGVVTGLAWTAGGGELLFIEALRMPGTGRLIITGLLGEVMRESVNAAYSYVRSRAGLLGIDERAFTDTDVHIHFPVGATPKDGPSAGAAVTLAIASSLADRPVRHDIAMTGEVTLRGRVLDIGGLKEKTLAAYRTGLREVILPRGNERDLRDVPDTVRAGMTFHPVGHMDEIFELALLPKPRTATRRSRSPGARGARARPAKPTDR